MTITSSGPVCDVCGKYILLDKTMEWFSVEGISGKLCCHMKCKPDLVYAIDNKDWTLLPPGPLRDVFERQDNG